MKKLYLIGGAMGVGKTTVSQILKKKLANSVFLDGDWCWDSDPFQVTEETKAMVIDNICYLLNNFLRCSAYDNIIFCWVMHEQAIIDGILSRLNQEDCRVYCISLICDPDTLTERLLKDVEQDVRASSIIEKSIPYLPKYRLLSTKKIDVTNSTPNQVADEITAL